MSPPELHPYESALAHLRIEGSVLLHGIHVPPWSVRVPDAAALRGLMNLAADVRVIPFHLVLSGATFLQPGSAPAIEVRAGEIVLLPGAMSHRLYSGAATETREFGDVMRLLAQRPYPRPAETAGTEMLCGMFALRSAPLNPLLAALPPVLAVPTQNADGSPMLGNIAQLLQGQVARHGHSGFTLSRLLEILCCEVFRAYGQTLGRQQAGWFQAIDDPQISRAVAQIQGAPAAPWTVAALASHVAMSPSRFAARFREVMAQSVMSYVTSWRMSCACRELRAAKVALSQVAADVGYQDVAAFSRAFKSHVGVSPAHWRRSAASHGSGN
jgi:AraC-like DNA-binding protein